MAALTLDDVVQRILAVVQAEPLAFTLAPTPESFLKTPAEAMLDGCVRVEAESGSVQSWVGTGEERHDTVLVEVARLAGGDPHATMQQLRVDAEALLSAIVADSLVGDYDVEDEGRGARIIAEPGRAALVLRLTVPVNYEAAL